MIWSMATDMNEHPKGPAVVLRLGGSARELCDEVDAAIIRDGCTMDVQDGHGERPISGLGVVLHGLAKHFAHLDGARGVIAIAELLTFRALTHEHVDDALSRFATLTARAANLGGLDPGQSGKA